MVAHLRAVLLLFLPLLVAVLDAPSVAATSASSSAGWVAVDSQTGSEIYVIACPSRRVCCATAAQGTVVGTRNGGSTWKSLLAGADPGPWGLACSTINTCIAGTASAFHILRTADGGQTWDLSLAGWPNLTDAFYNCHDPG